MALYVTRKISDRLEMNIELGSRLVQYSFPTYPIIFAYHIAP